MVLLKPVPGTLTIQGEHERYHCDQLPSLPRSLRHDLDPVVGGSIARCILCRVRKTSDAVARAA